MCKFIVLDRITWYKELLMLNTNAWNYLTVCKNDNPPPKKKTKTMINVKQNY